MEILYVTEEVEMLLQLQEDLRWDAFLVGLVHREQTGIVEDYLYKSDRKTTGRYWISRLVCEV